MKTLFPKKNHSRGDHIFQRLAVGSGIGLIVLIFAILFSLVVLGWDSIKTFGLAFLYSNQWNPVTQQFGALADIVGTLVTSIIAIIIAVPLSIGIAVLIIEILPEGLAILLARTVELMAGIPSIIYGMWGLFFLAPFLAAHVQPGLISYFNHIPVLNFIFGGRPIGFGIFTAGIILAIMIIPLISSVMRDVLSNAPELMKEAAYGVGATRWEIVKNVLIPYTRAGMLGGIILGLGRALGETMAVTFVVGNSHKLFTSLFMPGTTISATIANEFTEATGHLYSSALIELGLILFVITFIILSISRKLLHKSKITGGAH